MMLEAFFIYSFYYFCSCNKQHHFEKVFELKMQSLKVPARLLSSIIIQTRKNAQYFGKMKFSNITSELEVVRISQMFFFYFFSTFLFN